MPHGRWEEEQDLKDSLRAIPKKKSSERAHVQLMAPLLLSPTLQHPSSTSSTPPCPRTHLKEMAKELGSLLLRTRKAPSRGTLISMCSAWARVRLAWYHLPGDTAVTHPAQPSPAQTSAPERLLESSRGRQGLQWDRWDHSPWVWARASQPKPAALCSVLCAEPP